MNEWALPCSTFLEVPSQPHMHMPAATRHTTRGCVGELTYIAVRFGGRQGDGAPTLAAIDGGVERFEGQPCTRSPCFASGLLGPQPQRLQLLLAAC